MTNDNDNKKYNEYYTKEQATNSLGYEEVENFISPSSIQNRHLGKNVIRAENLVIGSKGFQSNATWSTTTSTISWDAHTIILGDNSVININAGSTSITNPNVNYYIYWESGSNDYFVTTIKKDTVGSDKFLVNTVKKDSNNIVTYTTADNSGTLISGDVIKTGKIQSTDGRTFFDLNGSKIQMSDASKPRFVANGTSPRFVISKAGHDANTATPENSLIYIDGAGTRLYFSKTFSSPTNTSPDAFNGAVSLIHYSSSNYKNAVLILDFFKEPSWIITKATFQFRFSPGYFNNGVTNSESYQQQMKVLMNPTKTKVDPFPAGAYDRYSGGLALILDGKSSNSFNLSSSELVFTDTLNSGEISNIVDGWNRIIVQTDNNNLDYTSYGIIQLNLNGYETIT